MRPFVDHILEFGLIGLVIASSFVLVNMPI